MRLNELHWFATAAFGLEGIVAAELKRLGMRDVLAQNGGVAFVGSPAMPSGPVCGCAVRTGYCLCWHSRRPVPLRSCFSW